MKKNFALILLICISFIAGHYSYPLINKHEPLETDLVFSDTTSNRSSGQHDESDLLANDSFSASTNQMIETQASLDSRRYDSSRTEE